VSVALQAPPSKTHASGDEWQAIKNIEANATRQRILEAGYTPPSWDTRDLSRTISTSRNAVKMGGLCWSAICKRGRHNKGRPAPQANSASERRHNLARRTMNDRRKRAALRTSRLHELLEQDEARERASVILGNERGANVAHEIAERVAERLASRKPFRSPGKELLADYRSME
jgi:hypothetical protein